MAGKSAGKLTWKWIVDVQFATTASGISSRLLPEFTSCKTQNEVWRWFLLIFFVESCKKLFLLQLLLLQLLLLLPHGQKHGHKTPVCKCKLSPLITCGYTKKGSGKYSGCYLPHQQCNHRNLLSRLAQIKTWSESCNQTHTLLSPSVSHSFPLFFFFLTIDCFFLAVPVAVARCSGAKFTHRANRMCCWIGEW